MSASLSQLRFLAKVRGSRLCSQKDLCPCKHGITLYISSPLCIYISWLKHKSFFYENVGLFSDFIHLVEKNLEVPMLMFSSLHVSLVTVTCRHQLKGQPSPARDSHLWMRRSLSAFLSILYLLVLLSLTLSYHLSLMQVLVC